MAATQIFRDAPIKAEKARPNGSMPNRLDPNLRGRLTIQQYAFGGLTEDPMPEILGLTTRSRRGHKTRGTAWIRTEWQSVFANS